MATPARLSLHQRAVHVLNEIVLLAGLALHLLFLFRLGYTWIRNFLCMLVYVSLMMPAYLQVAWFYFSSPQVQRSVVYGKKPRNRLDLFLPAADAPISASRYNKAADGRPVVVLVTGGVWIIGYKAWGALLAKRLMEQGVLVVSLDYRNFPQGTVSDMVQDVTTGVAWVQANAQRLGGDPRRVTLVGQSAGAHLAALALVRQAEHQALGNKGNGPQWDLLALSGFVGLSGGYRIDEALVEHFHARGLYRAVVYSIMEGGLTGKRAADALPRQSPESVVRSPRFLESRAGARLPPTLLLHGTHDRSMPPSQAAAFCAALRAAGAECAVKLYAGRTHSDPFLEGPILGGPDALVEDVLDVALGTATAARAPRTQPRLLPGPWVDFARLFMPF